MDLKSKGRTLVGNIYHKFETICQEVDEFVTKDTIKYVENQVQTVGESVKKMYSNVVQDFHPPLGDNKQAKAQAGTEIQIDAIGTNISSMVGIKEKHRCAKERESSKEQDIVDLRSCDTSYVDHLGQFSPPPSADSPQVAENDSLWIESSDSLNSPNGENSSGLSLISRTEDHRSTIPTKFSPVNSVNDAGLRVPQKDERTCNNFSDILGTNLSSELVSSGISWEHKVAETDASSCSESTELLDLLEFAHANSTQKTEEVCCGYTDSGGCASALSTISCASFSGVTSSDKTVNLVPAFPRTNSSADISKINESMFESSGNKHLQFFEGIVDDSVNDIVDADMETIDLSDKANLEESCVIVDNELLYTASCRPRKFISYKKMIQEAFASRKRLIKEYEQLAIWYGDIDTDTSLQSEQCLLPHMTSESRPSQTRDFSESEWELL